MRHQQSEYTKYASLEEPVTFEELITKITVDENTPAGLLGEWGKQYQNIRALVIAHKKPMGE